MFLSIDYDEGDQASYRGVEVRFKDYPTVRFETGDPVADWFAMTEFVNTIHDKTEDTIVMFTSSCDHFVMDGHDYWWDDDTGYLMKYGEDGPNG